MHPLVLELTGKKTPQTGLEGKFSVYFAAAVAIIHGAAGMREFSDENAGSGDRRPARPGRRHRRPGGRRKSRCAATITLKDGRVLNQFVEHVVGSLERPMSDADLEAKFADLAEGVLPDAQVRRLMDLCWKVEGLPSVAALAAAAVPTA